MNFVHWFTLKEENKLNFYKIWKKKELEKTCYFVESRLTNAEETTTRFIQETTRLEEQRFFSYKKWIKTNKINIMIRINLLSCWIMIIRNSQ